MPRTARIVLADAHPEGVVVATVKSQDGRLYDELDPGGDAQAVRLVDEVGRLADATAGPMVLDLRDVTIVDSGSCALLMRFRKLLLDRARLLVLCPSKEAHEVFEVTKLVRLIPCGADLAAAAELARHGPREEAE